MENLYKELRSFFANDMDLNDLFDKFLTVMSKIEM